MSLATTRPDIDRQSTRTGATGSHPPMTIFCASTREITSLTVSPQNLQQAEPTHKLRTIEAEMPANLNTYQSLSSSGHKVSWQPINAVEKSLRAEQSASALPSPIHSAVELRWENEGWT
ncbi:MAG: hypothetical protein ACKOEF_11045, partial [Acidimicrobiaceae bacterium]